MNTVWKVGMRYSHPEFMLQNELAYVFGDSMSTYIENMRLGDVQPDDIVILAKSVQKGINKIGIVKSFPKYCLCENINASDFEKMGISPSTDNALISEFIKLKHTDVVYFFVDWLNFTTTNIEANFLNTYGFTVVADDENIISYVNNFLEMKKSIELLLSNKNLVFTGAPGTGKTYLAKSIAKELILSPDVLKNIDYNLFEPYRNVAINSQDIDKVNESWQYWKKRILSDDFNLDDYANTLSNIEDKTLITKGGYLTCFLERKSSLFGSSKPGNAFNYGIKLNSDNYTYSIYDDSESCTREEAERIFNEKIKSWFQKFVKSGFEEKMAIIDSGHDLIKATQLLRKVIVLDHPDKLLSIYQDIAISNAYSYFLPEGTEKSYFKQNISLTEALMTLFKLERNIPNLLRLTSFIWVNFNRDSKVSIDELKENYLNEYCKFVQFHPSFDYTDFVEGLRPSKNEDQEEIGFVLKNGIFKEFCLSAIETWKNDLNKKDSEKKKFVFIIDEINRAEISKVFGELFFSIDPGYRGEKGKVKTQYSNLQNSDYYFFVPENVYLIGTMNDIDRSVESFDFAMRRRFAWKELTSEERKSMWDGEIDLWKEEAGKRMLAINSTIEKIEGLDSSYHIGPAYFLKLKEYKGDFQKLWENHVSILVKEYLRGTHDMMTNFNKLKNAFNLVIDITDAN